MSSPLTAEKTIIKARESYPTCEPAMTIRVGLAGQFPCGDIHTGSTLVGVPLGEGTLESVGDFEPKMKFKLTSGHDWFRIDADKKHGRLSVSVIATDEAGRSIRLIADGVCELNEHTMPLILGSPDAKTNPWGFGGHESYKVLESMMFACSQRFAIGEGGAPVAEIRISRIIPGSGFE
ncbi:hypothetical protein F5B17DRAFT_445595 [Nemania serpens]|nr:hypothetical protein F5B17DRAFT_445595 [Nemania serpens]